MEVNSLLLKHCFASPRGKKRQKLLCIGSKLSWFKFVFLLLGNDKDYDNECLRKKNIIWDQCHFAFSTESVRFRTEGPWRHMYGSLSIFSTSYQLWPQIRRIAFYRHLRSISFLMTIRNSILYVNQRSFLEICRHSWWKFAYDHFWL